MDCATLPQALASLEREALTAALIANRWQRKATARELGISPCSLDYRMRRSGLISTRRRNVEFKKLRLVA